MTIVSDMTGFDWIGVIGSILIAVAYFSVSTKRMEGDSAAFQLLNLVGAILILWSLWYRPNVGAILIEVLWIGIAVWSLGKRWLKK